MVAKKQMQDNHVLTKDKEVKSEYHSLGIFNLGIEYLNAANTLNSCVENTSIEMMKPRVYLYSHAFELALKSYIYRMLGYEVWNKNKKGHNFYFLIRIAKNNGLSISNTLLIIGKWFQRLNANGYLLRYHQSGPYRFVRPDEISKEINGLYKIIARDTFKFSENQMKKLGNVNAPN